MVSNFFPPEAKGGAEIYASDLVNELVARGIEVDVITSTRLRARTERRGNLTVKFFHSVPPLPRVTSDFLGYNFNPWARRLSRDLAKGAYDLVHVHNINSSIMLSPLVGALHGPTICHIHDHWPICYRGVMYDTWNQRPCESERSSCCFNPGRRTIGGLNLALRARLLRRLKDGVQKFITPSQHMTRALVSRGFANIDKIRLVRLGLDLSKVPEEPNSRSNSFLFVGRNARYKNAQFPVELLSRGHVDSRVSFRIIGGDSRETSNAISKLNEGQRDKVHLLGTVPREAVFKELVGSRGLLLPSLVPENSPLVAYEALACGTPILCSDTGGTRELVEDSGGGQVLSIEDAGSWEKAIGALMDGSFAEISRRAVGYARSHLGIDKSAAGVLAVYDEVCR